MCPSLCQIEMLEHLGGVDFAAANTERFCIELMASDRKLKASRKGSR